MSGQRRTLSRADQQSRPGVCRDWHLSGGFPDLGVEAGAHQTHEDAMDKKPEAELIVRKPASLGGHGSVKRQELLESPAANVLEPLLKGSWFVIPSWPESDSDEDSASPSKKDKP